MVATIDRYLVMPGKEMLLFRLGCSGGVLRMLKAIVAPVRLVVIVVYGRVGKGEHVRVRVSAGIEKIWYLSAYFL